MLKNYKKNKEGSDAVNATPSPFVSQRLLNKVVEKIYTKDTKRSPVIK